MNQEQYWELVEEYEKEIVRRLITREEYIPDHGSTPKLAQRLAKLRHHTADAWDMDAKIMEQANKNVKAKLRRMFRVR